MTTPTNETRGWTGTPGPVAGSRNYTHPHYVGCKIYDAGAGGAITVYCDGETVSEHDSVDEAIAWTAENVVAIRRRETISAVDHERYVRGIAEILDPSAFDGSDPSGDGPAGQHRRDAARETAREVLKATGAPQPTSILDQLRQVAETAGSVQGPFGAPYKAVPAGAILAILDSGDVTMADSSIELAHQNAGTVDPNRVVPADEIKALATIETVERGMQLAIQIIGSALTAPSPTAAAAKLKRATLLLSHLTGVTSNRTCTAVKRQELSDQISVQAREQLTQINNVIDEQILKADERSTASEPTERERNWGAPGGRVEGS
jgi:hypothetical protein